MEHVAFQAESTAEALLELLAARGVEYFLAAGTGTDFPPIIEAYAKRLACGLPVPKPITVVHEITAAAMAHGYAMVAGKPAFAMVHTIVGTANVVSGVINASRARVPMIMAAGRTAYSEKGHPASRSLGVHWAQESFDQAGMLREFVKWDYCLQNGAQLETVLDRAFAIAQSEPAGPVYLTLPIETLADRVGGTEYATKARLQPAGASTADPATVRAAAKALLGARNPIVITTAVGRDPMAVSALVELAECLGLPVVEHWHTHLNFPQSHPLHLGYDTAALVRDADVVLVIESDAPWFPCNAEPAQNATVIQLDEDPLYQRYPFRGFPTDISLTGSARLILPALVNAIRAAGVDATLVRERTERWARQHHAQRAEWRRAAEVEDRTAPLHPQWISRCVGEALGPNDIAITEYVLDPTQTCFTQPGSYFNHSHAAGLGWATGAALGAKLARPDATVVCCVGDGAYNFGVPVSTHYMSRTNHLPVLFVVYNNAAWGKSRKAAAAFAPDGWTARSASVPLCELGPSPEYHLICAASGGYGELVEDAAELPRALQRALHAVRHEGRQALLNVRTNRE